MFEYQLFLGFPLTEDYQRELSKLSPSFLDMFIQHPPSPYLQQIESEGIVYLGKSLGSSIELTSLDSQEAHIYSLLKKLVFHYPYPKHPLVLIALPVNES